MDVVKDFDRLKAMVNLGVYTVNEIREASGYNPLPNGDMLSNEEGIKKLKTLKTLIACNIHTNKEIGKILEGLSLYFDEEKERK